MQRSALCISRRELSNEYVLTKIGVDTAENEPLEVWVKIQFIIHLPPDLLRTRRDQVVLSPLEEIWGTLLTKQAQSIAPKKSKNAANYRD